MKQFTTNTGPLEVYVSNFNQLKVRQTFPMQGSKRTQVPIIIKLVPPDTSSIIEAFCGSAAVSLGLRASGFSNPVLLNDKNPHISCLWQQIIADPLDLADRYEEIWSRQFGEEFANSNSREYFMLIRERFNNSANPDPADFLFILNRIVKGALRYNKDGKINQSADGRRFGAKPKITRDRLVEAATLLKGAKVTNADWREAVLDATPNDFLYLDPPYQGTTETRDRRYSEGLAYREFQQGVVDLVNREISAVISYDAIAGPVTYGRPLHHDVDLFAIDVITGRSAQGTLLGRDQASHETLYLTPALLERLGGVEYVIAALTPSTKPFQINL